MRKIPIRRINAPVKEPELSGSFSIRDVGVLLSGKDMVQDHHRHDFFFILVLQKGKGEHIIDFESYSISDHSVFFLRPGQVHQLTLKKGSTGYVMQFNKDFYTPRDYSASQLLRKVSNKNYCQFKQDSFDNVLLPLTIIFREFTGKQEKYKEAIKASLEIFFIELARQSRDSKKVSNASNQYSQELLEKFLELLQTHITTKKQVTEYADMLHLTPYRLNSITKATLGKTSSELINDQVILEAKRNLLATSNQVNQIAGELGYEDVSYFIRFFKKHMGYSPEAFRNNFK